MIHHNRVNKQFTKRHEKWETVGEDGINVDFINDARETAAEKLASLLNKRLTGAKIATMLLLMHHYGDPKGLAKHQPLRLLTVIHVFTKVIAGALEFIQLREQSSLPCGFSATDHTHTLTQMSEK